MQCFGRAVSFCNLLPLRSAQRGELFDVLVDMRKSIDGTYPTGLKYPALGITPTFPKKKGKEKVREGVDYVEEAELGAFNAGDDERMLGVEGETEVESLDISRPGPSSAKRRKVTRGKGGNN